MFWNFGVTDCWSPKDSMGAGASAVAALPEHIDEPTAKSFAGAKFNKQAFDRAANEGLVHRDEFMRAAGSRSTSFLDLPPDVINVVLRLIGNPLLPSSSVALISCCKTLRAMPSLKKSIVALKKPRKEAKALASKVGTTLERMGSAAVARQAWDKKGLKPADIKTFVTSVACYMPKLCELDLRANEIGDVGLKHLIDASAKGCLPKLYCLALSNNQITSSGASMLAAAALAKPAAFLGMQTLMLNQNEIAAEAMSILATALADGCAPTDSNRSIPPGASLTTRAFVSLVWTARCRACSRSIHR